MRKVKQKKFQAILNQQIRVLVAGEIKTFSDPVVPTIQELEKSAEKITATLAEITGIPMKTIISRMLWLYYQGV